MSSINVGDRVQIPVALIEFDEGGTTLWVHDAQGATVLRLKFMGGIHSDICTTNISSHADAIYEGPLAMCVHEKDLT